MSKDTPVTDASDNKPKPKKALPYQGYPPVTLRYVP